MIILCKGDTIRLEHLPADMVKGHDDHRPMFSSREYEEAEKIRAVLKQFPQDRPAAANALGMSRTTLWRKMKKYGLLE